MTVLRIGMHGAAVRRLQSLLSASQALQQPLVADGHFGNLTHAAVTAFQRKSGLTVDGVVGAETWKALEAHPLAAELFHYRVGPQEALADIAAMYVGATEAAGNRMGDDARMREIFEADDLANRDGTTDGYAWCCAFVYTFSHIGIVEGTGSGSLQTIEGNTNEQGSREGTTCRRKQRARAEVRCFIRLPVVANSC